MDPDRMNDAAPPHDESRSRDSFRRLLGDVRSHVDLELATWLRPRVAKAMAVSAEVGAAAQEIERLSLRGGKRMRAALVGAAFVASGGDDWKRVDRAMIAIELLQTYLLIHDDWMDDDDVRRGGPSVHVSLRERLGSKALGDAAAVLAGDLASGYAQAALLEIELPEARVLGAARAFAKIQEDVVTGQLAEMCSVDGRGVLRKAAPSVETIHELKTASYTVTGPLALGARLAGASEAHVAELARYGRPLGIAFQLRDDLLGAFGDPSETGKPVGNDVRQGKRTALVTEMRGDARSEALLGRVLGRTDATDEDVAEVVRAMESSGAKGRVEARLAELLAEARAALSALNLPEENAARGWLGGAIAALGDRAS